MSGENGMPELKLCPFCGGTPVLDGKSDDVLVRCESGCQARGPAFYFDGEDDDEIAKAESDARAAWNARACMRAAGDDAERWRLFTEGPYPICYRGEMFSDRESLNAAVDQARKS